MLNIKKSILFTAYYADGKLTCVRCNLTGRFVKRSIYLAVESKHTTANGVITNFNVATLIDSLENHLAWHKKDFYNDTKIALFIAMLSVPMIFVFGQVFKLVTSLVY